MHPSPYPSLAGPDTLKLRVMVEARSPVGGSRRHSTGLRTSNNFLTFHCAQSSSELAFGARAYQARIHDAAIALPSLNETRTRERR